MPRLTFRIAPALKKSFDAICKTRKQSLSSAAVFAINDFVEVQEQQIAGIKKALKQADAGTFATDQEVRRVFARLKKRRR